MILSVLKNTNRPVKFWFIKNYLSPQFKVYLSVLLICIVSFFFRFFWFNFFPSLIIFQDVIPHMAQEYGFEYELITYKWPTWLHKQKEKQRIIWAYKILFLDVIFPLALEKVFLFCHMIALCCSNDGILVFPLTFLTCNIILAGYIR